MMRLDDDIARYFIECESLLVKFFNKYVDNQNIEIVKLGEQITDIKSKSDILFIYEIDMVDRNKRYSGKSTSL
jgi:hypothetical protein